MVVDYVLQNNAWEEIMGAITEALSGFDFAILDDPNTKEDTVREEIVAPIVKALGYKSSGNARIIRSKRLDHPYISLGSKTKKISIIPDYVAEVDGKCLFILDAKAPNENILTGSNVEQAYSYAIHPDIRARYYCLCNGKMLSLYEITSTKPLLSFLLRDISTHESLLLKYLSPNSLLEVASKSEVAALVNSKDDFDYLSCKPPKEIAVKKQAAKRHFGAHAYFTKQAWNVVQAYIVAFTQEGDTVLDPFSGSGVTPIEAFYTNRKGIGFDINPFAVFISSALAKKVDYSSLDQCFEQVVRRFNNKRPKSEAEIDAIIAGKEYPHGIKLPIGADVSEVQDLFSPKQLADLTVLRKEIRTVKDEGIRDSLLFAFSSTVTKTNLTYHSSKKRSENAGDCGAFRYYRYRLAPKAIELDVIAVFKEKYSKMVKAKKELLSVEADPTENLRILKGDANCLSQIKDESIDYIYTDPPYGANIPYLDLSVMWNAWLDLDVTEEDYEAETIEGGSKNKTSEEYSNLLANSIREMYRILKFNRWVSFVYAHKDPRYWDLIINTAQDAGFQYESATRQSSSQESFKKRQNPFSVLTGQLIVNFKKVASPVNIQRRELGKEVSALIIQTVEEIIAEKHGATIEEINDALVIRGLEQGFLHLLSKKYKSLIPILQDSFNFDTVTKRYHIKKAAAFKTHVPVEKRIRYYLTSFLKEKLEAGEDPTIDDVILEVMPLLRNGSTPSDQTIINVLKEIAQPVDNNGWRLRQKSYQRELF